MSKKYRYRKNPRSSSDGTMWQIQKYQKHGWYNHRYCRTEEEAEYATYMLNKQTKPLDKKSEGPPSDKFSPVIKSWKCDICGAESKNRQGIKSHITRVHG